MGDPHSESSAALYAPIGSQALVDRVRQRLQNAIATGVLRPGEKLPGEAVLASRFHVSLVTVREALQQLRATGYLVTRQGRGGGSFVDIDAEKQQRLLDERILALTRAEIADFGTYFRAISDAVLTTIGTMGLGENLAVYRETFLQAEAQAEDGAAARSVQGSLDLRLAGESQSVRLVHEQIRIQNEFAALLWMGLDDKDQRRLIFRHNEGMLDAMIAGDVASAIDSRHSAVESSLVWLLARRTDAQRRDNERTS